MVFELLRWWYGAGWLRAMSRIQTRTTNVLHAFSAGTLLKTLFSPWKRIQYAGRSFDAKVQALVDNFVSRTIGFIVRIGVLIAAGLMTLGSLIVSIAIVIVWPFIPFVVVFLFYKGFV